MTTAQTPHDSAPVTPETILAAARALVPELRARSRDIEDAGRIPTDLMDELRAAGVFRMGFPRQFGGPELTSAQQLEVIEALSYGDTSAGWCAMVGMDAGMYALSDSAVSDMFPSLDAVVAGMLTPVGRADRVPGGYRVSGQWTMASGIHHAQWVCGGAFVHDETGAREVTAHNRPYWRVMMLRPERVRLIENWDTTGLRGTGSIDFEISAEFVPEENTFSLGEHTRTGPLAASDALMRKMPGVAIGTARAALDHVRAIAQTKHDKATGRPWAQDYRVQYTLGDCEMRYLTARHAVYGTVEDRWRRMDAGAGMDDLTPDERVATALARFHAMRTSRDIVRTLYDLLASQAIYTSSPMDRWLRDMETMCQHVMAQDRIVQSCGAHLVGGRPQFPLVLGFV
ncbi:acyl-CoA dehydrogenase family protein [Nocardia fluminea]|uniref:acyl-CoA dehydrogenase family protein n=1 Tax=Nocardia fluminea TaxID=134984 RepID=UPI00341E438E